ncbi:MmgE/PrpD family protein [Rhodobacterales bacterium LSUCC0031]|nr:MmgE/PrpD family protein [Rhodobacterales bacterium LSUCC0031]
MTTSPTIAEALASRIHGFQPADVTPKARLRARIAVIDTVGVSLAGAGMDCVTHLRALPGVADAPGPCTLIGQRGTASMLDAALINGTAAHALDYDDFSSVFGGHQSAPILPALFALAEAEGHGGEAVMTAYTMGVETEIRIARAVHFHHYDKGWHPTATLGTFGAAAACAHLMGLSETPIATALALAASQAAGIKANFGTMTKPFHVGQCARAGLLAALMARQGYSANHAAFEHPQGFLEVFNGAGTYDATRIFANWAAPLELEDDGIAIKPYPCCGSAHAAIEAALNLRDESALDPKDIAKITILPHPRRLPHTDNPWPKTELEAKFSVQYLVARALLDGAIKLAHFEQAAIADPIIHDLLGRIDARPHPEMGDHSASQWAAEVIVETTTGARLAHRIDDLMGGGGGVPDTIDAMRAKFMDCAAVIGPSDWAARLFDALADFDRAPALGPIVAQMAPPA